MSNHKKHMRLHIQIGMCETKSAANVNEILREKKLQTKQSGF